MDVETGMTHAELREYLHENTVWLSEHAEAHFQGWPADLSGFNVTNRVVSAFREQESYGASEIDRTSIFDFKTEELAQEFAAEAARLFDVPIMT